MKKLKFAINTAKTIGQVAIIEALNNVTFTPTGEKLPSLGALSSDMTQKLKEQGVTAIAVLEPSVAKGFAIPSLEKASQFAGSLGTLAKQSQSGVVIAGIVKNSNKSSQLVVCQTNKHAGLDIGLVSATLTPSSEGEVMTLSNLPKPTYKVGGKENATILKTVASGLSNATVVDTKCTSQPIQWIDGKMPVSATLVDIPTDEFSRLSSFQKVKLTPSEMRSLTKEVSATVGSPKATNGTLITAIAVEGEIICFQSENPTNAFKIPTETEGTTTTLHG